MGALCFWVFWSVQLSYQALFFSVQTSSTRLKAECDCFPLQSWMSLNFRVQRLIEKYPSISLMIMLHNKFINAGGGRLGIHSLKSLLSSSNMCKLQMLHDPQVRLVSILLFMFTCFATKLGFFFFSQHFKCCRIIYCCSFICHCLTLRKQQPNYN